ncbi:hypothetical protein IAT38_003838 [Cryptococcus sp. DSM 104549]
MARWLSTPGSDAQRYATVQDAEAYWKGVVEGYASQVQARAEKMDVNVVDPSVGRSIDDAENMNDIFGGGGGASGGQQSAAGEEEQPLVIPQ